MKTANILAILTFSALAGSVDKPHPHLLETLTIQQTQVAMRREEAKVVTKVTDRFLPQKQRTAHSNKK